MRKECYLDILEQRYHEQADKEYVGFEALNLLTQWSQNKENPSHRSSKERANNLNS